MTVELARRGFMVKAADSTPSMVEIASRRVAEAGVADRVRLLVADAHQLAFACEAFTLVVALGVVPWLRSAPLAVAEMTRVLLFGLPLTSERVSARLQRLADDGVPWIRSGGGQYLVLARAPIRARDAQT